jgi:hypothetical protein
MSKREFSFADMRPSRVAKKTVSYCDTNDSELKFDEVGYEWSKTKNDPRRGLGFQRTNHLEKIPSSRMSKRNHDDDGVQTHEYTGHLIVDLGHHREVHCTVRFSNRDSNGKRNSLMIKDTPKVFEAAANDYDQKPPTRCTVLPPPPCICLMMQRRRRRRWRKRRRRRRRRRRSFRSILQPMRR